MQFIKDGKPLRTDNLADLLKNFDYEDFIKI